MSLQELIRAAHDGGPRDERLFPEDMRSSVLKSKRRSKRSVDETAAAHTASFDSGYYREVISLFKLHFN